MELAEIKRDQAETAFSPASFSHTIASVDCALAWYDLENDKTRISTTAERLIFLREFMLCDFAVDKAAHQELQR